jgi:hypothetical protein
MINCHSDRLVDAAGLGVVRLGDHRVEALIVEVYEDRIHALNDAIDRPVVEIQKAKRASMTGLALDIGHVQHLGEVEDVRVKMNPVHTIGDVARKVGQIGVADVFPDLNVLERKPRNLTVDPLCCAVLVPAASCHVRILRSSKTSG